MTGSRQDTSPASAASSWSGGGIREEAAFLGPPRNKVMAVLHTPAQRTPVAAMVMCSSLFEDLQVQYRREILLARALTARGVAVVRFHYRGSGNSDAVEDGAVTFGSLLDDGRVALTWARERTATTRIGFYGGKFGAVVASALAREHGSGPVVLSSPMASGRDYFRQISRVGQVAGLRASGDSAGVGLEQQLDANGFADLLGNRVDKPTHDDLLDRTLDTDLGEHRPVLLVQVAPAESLTRHNEELVAQLKSKGAEVETVLVRERERWFVPDQWEPEDTVPETKAFSEGVSDWVARVVEAGS